MTTVEGASIAGKSINGCVFFICTAGIAGGLGKTVIRAVSFFGAGIVIGAAIEAAAARTGEGKSAGADRGFAAGCRVGK